ncbi:MAG: hypothetical protein O7E52_20475, partial [Candidatus Poribacteria bacterium]|nr:hypothetical protein [Candidatus Poribacteria bacterium]
KVIFSLLGCINNKEKITFYADGTADIEAIVEISDGDVGDEEGRSGWRVWIWMYRYMFPELRENYTLTEEFVSETQRLRFIFKNRRRFKIQNTDLLSFTQQSNGAFTFSSTIPKFSPNGEESDEANSEVIFELTVEMPKEIERSNATSIDGKAAKWAITWEDLTKELTLKAVTKN